MPAASVMGGPSTMVKKPSAPADAVPWLPAITIIPEIRLMGTSSALKTITAQASSVTNQERGDGALAAGSPARCMAVSRHRRREPASRRRLARSGARKARHPA